MYGDVWETLMTRFALLSCLLLVPGWGCAKEPAAPAEVPQAGAAVAPAESGDMTSAPGGQSETPETPSEDPAVGLKTLDWKAARALVDAHRGKIVVMDLWATYCPPCVQEFPGLVKLHREHGDQVVCISVSLDYQGFEDEPVESCRERVLTFLKKMNAQFENILLSTDSETVLVKEIGTGSIPVVYVFDRNGEKAAEFPDPNNPDEFTYEGHIIPVVEKLLERQ